MDSSDNSSNFGIDIGEDDLIFKDQPKKVEAKPQLLSCENKDSSIVEINEQDIDINSEHLKSDNSSPTSTSRSLFKERKLAYND